MVNGPAVNSMIFLQISVTAGFEHIVPSDSIVVEESSCESTSYTSFFSAILLNRVHQKIAIIQLNKKIHFLDFKL